MEYTYRIRKTLASSLTEKGCRKSAQEFVSVSWAPPANRNISNEEDSLLHVLHGTYYTAEEWRSCHQLEESSTASFTFMEQHPLPPAADSPPLCSSAPLRQQFFPQQLHFLFVAFCCGHWEKSKCVLHGWTLEIVEKITPHKATLCQLLLHLRSPWHCLVGVILLLCCREGSAFVTPASSAVCVKPSYQSQEEENAVCFFSEWKKKLRCILKSYLVLIKVPV